jgi:hypothetical protein
MITLGVPLSSFRSLFSGLDPRRMRLMTGAGMTAHRHRFRILRMAAARPALATPSADLILGSPSAPLSFVMGRAPLFIPFFDVMGLSNLLVRIGTFVTAWH